MTVRQFSIAIRARVARAPATALVLLGAAILLPGTAHAEAFSDAAGRGVVSAFLFAFTAGFLTSLTPCVYPMIPITISVFGGRRGVPRVHAVALATLYVAGIATMFGTLGTTFALLGRAFGTFLANPWVVVPLALFFFAMAASMFGAFDLALPSGLQQRLARVGGRGFLGAFLMGLVGGLIAAPCTGPPLAGILAYVATTRDGLRGFLLLATYAAGIGVPFWAIAGFSLHLPKSGAWMEGVKSVFGIALAVAGLYYLRVVFPPLAQVTGRSSTFLAAAVAAVGLGILLGAVNLSFHAGSRTRLRKTLGVALTVAGLFAAINYFLTPKIPQTWLSSEAAGLAHARVRGKPVVMDFTADWCLPCREFEVSVFARPEVVALLENFVLVKIDLTREDQDDALPALKDRYGVSTLPAVRFLAPGGQIVGRIDSLVPWHVFRRELLGAQEAAERR
ncbi:MAG TPA: cytochrome c biogenesis protein CcdA [Polyangia bacterium]|nr:cytochrome c biogenesis protein CcdA [Polyangia bacterium]